MAYKRSDNFDSVLAFGQSDFKVLEKGGYICRLIMAEELQDRNGNPMLHVAWDIIEGPFKNYFMDTFKARKQATADKPHAKEVKWPFEGQKWIQILDYEDKTRESRQFKGFCTAVTDSGADIWTPKGELNLEELKGAEVGVIYQMVENEWEGKTYWRAQPWGFRSIEAVATGDYFQPDDKPLPEADTTGTGFVSTGSADSFNAVMDDLPF